MTTIAKDVMRRIQLWLDGPYDEATKSEIQSLFKNDPQQLSDAFFKDLSFGTGGMRGIMGVGTNRLNIYTIRSATQGLANYLKKSGPLNQLSVFIGYDVRHHSKEFAQAAASVLAGNHIKVYLTKDICPTPLVSFGCRHFQCSAAIMITASHNPPIYNGYKVYWSDGGQVVFPHDEGIITEVHNIKTLNDVSIAPLDSPLIHRIGSELDEAYFSAIQPLQLYPELASSSIQVLYTPLHGTGIRNVPAALNRWGYQNVRLVRAQQNPDPDFTNAPSPNPEEPKALQLGSQELVEQKKDLLIATDPDADRMGVVALDKGQGVRLTGNQTACLLLFHICSTLQNRGELPKNSAFVKTIVTTELFAQIATAFHATCVDLLTGFKYIGEQITLWEKKFDGLQYLFGAEESYGYLYGTHVRDKDSIISACLITEAAALAKKQNITLIDRLYQLYEQFGVHRESLTSQNFPDSAEGMKQMQEQMQRLRAHPPASIGGIPVVCIEDYEQRQKINLIDRTSTPLSLPRSDVLRFWLQDRSKLVIRPSGTEPKVKIYAEVMEENPDRIEQSIQRCDQRLKNLVDAFLA